MTTPAEPNRCWRDMHRICNNDCAAHNKTDLGGTPCVLLHAQLASSAATTALAQSINVFSTIVQFAVGQQQTG